MFTLPHILYQTLLNPILPDAPASSANGFAKYAVTSTMAGAAFAYAYAWPGASGGQ